MEKGDEVGREAGGTTGVVEVEEEFSAPLEASEKIAVDMDEEDAVV